MTLDSSNIVVLALLRKLARLKEEQPKRNDPGVLKTRRKIMRMLAELELRKSKAA